MALIKYCNWQALQLKLDWLLHRVIKMWAHSEGNVADQQKA